MLKTGLIVGAGLTGCAAALDLARRGLKVTVYDAAPAVGGIVRDLVFDARQYFNGCQYLSPNAPWLLALQQELDCGLHDFELTYSSYTALLDEERTVHHDFPGPVVQRSLDGFSETRSADESLRERVLCYPDVVASRLLEWLERFGGDPGQLHRGCALGMQVARLYFALDDAQVVQRKRESTTADDLIGVPRSSLNPSAARPRSSLPVHGFNEFLASLRRHLEHLGVTFVLGATVSCRSKPHGEIGFFSRGQALTADCIVWCGNPVPLINASGVGRLQNIAAPMQSIACDVEGSERPLQPHYIQVFSRETPITRVYLYAIGEESRATIECFDHQGFTPDAVLADAVKILAESGRDLRLTCKGGVPQKRYVLFTTDDVKLFTAFDDYAERTRIVGGAWWEYGRDAKIKRIADSIAARFA